MHASHVRIEARDPVELEDGAPGARLDGVVEGVTLLGTGNGSIFQSMGLQDHDVITRIDGKPADAESMQRLLVTVGGGRDSSAAFSLVVERGGETLALNFRVE